MRTTLFGASATLLASLIALPATASAASAAPVPASARRGAETAITGFARSTAEVDIGQRSVSFSGRLSSGGTGLPGRPISIQSAGATVATGRTGPGGAFSVDVPRLPHGGAFNAAFPGSADYAASSSGSAMISVRTADVRLVLVNSGIVRKAGWPDTYTGRYLYRDGSGTLRPAPYARARLFFLPRPGEPATETHEVVTGADGRFIARLVVKAETYMQLRTDEADEREFVAPMVSNEIPVAVAHRSAVKGFDVLTEPAPIGGLARYRFQLRVESDKPNVWGPYTGHQGAVYFLPRGTKRWRYVGLSPRSDAQGNVTGSVRVPGDGTWRIQLYADGYVFARRSVDDYVDARYATRIMAFNAAPEPVRKGRKITLSGGLAYSDPGNPLLPPVKRRTVKFYFCDAKTKKWTYAGSDVTDSDGWFKRQFVAKRDGTWQAYFAGDAGFLKSFGKDDYVDVR